MILKVLLSLFFVGNYGVFSVLMNLLLYIGIALILKKCGEKMWKAAIPFYRMYVLAKCANRVFEGNVVCVLELITTVFQILQLTVPSTTKSMVFTIILLVVALNRLVYLVRLYNGVCQLFDRRKWWTLLWITTEFIPALLWGISPKFTPKWTTQDMEKEVNDYLSNAYAEVMNEGLTVNLTERTATEMGKKKVLLRDVHMNIAPGRMVLLLGGSGAGKTTLLNAINGYEKAKAEVHLNGTNVYTQYKAMQYEIGFVPQSDLMRGKDTVISTLLDSANLRLPEEVTRAGRNKRVNEVMETFGLKRLKNTMVEKLSGGQRKRLSIAMEFISNPTLFILDEPDSGLDGIMARELMVQLRSIADRGKIVIVITHTPDRVIDLFDDVIVLAKDSAETGRLAFYGPIEQAKQFFERDSMEKIVRCINRTGEGGEGRADEFVKKFGEVQNG